MATYKGVVPSSKYTFNASAKTITLDTDYTGIALSDIMLITNVKSGTAITIYDPFDPTKGGTLSTLTLTLNYNTAAMSNSDPLQIIIGMTSLPTSLPTDAATETTLSTLNGKIPSNLTVTSTRLLVDGSGVTQPVSGTFWQTTQPVSIASSVAVTGPLTDTQLRASAVPVSLASLPSLAAGSNTIGSIANTSFASTQSGTWSTRTQDGSGNAITSTSNALDVNVKNSSIAVTGTFYQATQPVSGTVTANISGSISNTSFDATQGSAASLKNQPHVLVSASQPSYSDTDVAPMSLTTAGNLRVDGSSVTQPISGTVTISSGTISVSQSTAASLNATVVGTGTFAVQAAQSGTWNVGTVSTITNAVTVSQGTATNLKAQAESYQGGSAVSSSNPLYVAQLPVTSGGVVPVTGSSVGGTSAITLYSSPGQVYGWYFYNAGANAGYVFFYDTGSAITVGTTTPYYVLVIPPTSGANVFGIGITHTNSIKIGISQGRSSGTALSTAIDYTIFYK